MAGGCSGISLCPPVQPLHKGAGGLPRNTVASGQVSLCKALGAPGDEAGAATPLRAGPGPAERPLAGPS